MSRKKISKKQKKNISKRKKKINKRKLSKRKQSKKITKQISKDVSKKGNFILYLIIFFIIGSGLGFGGYYFYQKNKKNKKSKTYINVTIQLEGEYDNLKENEINNLKKYYASVFNVDIKNIEIKKGSIIIEIKKIESSVEKIESKLEKKPVNIFGKVYKVEDTKLEKFNTENNSGITENNSRITENNSGITENNSGITENNSGITENNSGITENNSGTTENNSGNQLNEEQENKIERYNLELYYLKKYDYIEYSFINIKYSFFMFFFICLIFIIYIKFKLNANKKYNKSLIYYYLILILFFCITIIDNFFYEMSNKFLVVFYAILICYIIWLWTHKDYGYFYEFKDKLNENPFVFCTYLCFFSIMTFINEPSVIPIFIGYYIIYKYNINKPLLPNPHLSNSPSNNHNTVIVYDQIILKEKNKIYLYGISFILYGIYHIFNLFLDFEIKIYTNSYFIIIKTLITSLLYISFIYTYDFQHRNTSSSFKENLLRTFPENTNTLLKYFVKINAISLIYQDLNLFNNTFFGFFKRIIYDFIPIGIFLSFILSIINIFILFTKF